MFEPALLALRDEFEGKLKSWLDRPLERGEFFSKRLHDSMKYGLSSPGKRLRPLMVLLMARTFGKNNWKSLAMPAALAVELLHTYSLIHDDLPAMDDDDFRRGRLSTHRRFDEGLAILAGDALLADAFYLASSCKNNPHKITMELAKTAGSRALVAGQAEDLKTIGPKDWLMINEAKTARLFEASAVMGALAVGAKPQDLQVAQRVGHHFGMAFQIKDDLDDAQGLASLAGSHELATLKDAHLECMLELLPKNCKIRELAELTFNR